MGSSDITKCASKDCREEGWCWRKTTKGTDYQSYIDFSDTCCVYRPNWAKVMDSEGDISPKK